MWGKILIIYLGVVNLLAFLLFGIDKRRAVRNKWRIPEKTLLLVAGVGGAAGSLLGMIVWHHKTRKWKFRILVPLFLAIWIFLFCRFMYGL